MSKGMISAYGLMETSVSDGQALMPQLSRRNRETMAMSESLVSLGWMLRIPEE
jgi:hypothetical protein